MNGLSELHKCVGSGQRKIVLSDNLKKRKHLLLYIIKDVFYRLPSWLSATETNKKFSSTPLYRHYTSTDPSSAINVITFHQSQNKILNILTTSYNLLCFINIINKKNLILLLMGVPVASSEFLNGGRGQNNCRPLLVFFSCPLMLHFCIEYNR